MQATQGYVVRASFADSTFQLKKNKQNLHFLKEREKRKERKGGRGGALEKR